MALDKTSLKTRITTELASQGFNLTNAPMTEKMAEAIANAVIDEITINAMVNTTVTGVTGTGAPGGPLPITAQPGIGTVS